MKYPTGSYMVKDGERRKILAALDSLRWFSEKEGGHDWETQTSGIGSTIEELERGGWEEEKGPWEPKAGDTYWMVGDDGETYFSTVTGEEFMKKRIAVGNCFETRELAKKAAERVRKAYKRV